MPGFLDWIGPALKAGLSMMGKQRLPYIEGVVLLPGMKAPVEILRDKSGVPHIYAQNPPDLYFAQGFCHAQDRLWQMELNRRTASGTLSELFGVIAIDTDRAVRTFGFHRLGQQDWDSMPAPNRLIITAYTAGVNAYLESVAKKTPIEFTLLGHRPSPWTIQDTMALSRLMIWQMSHAWYNEIVHARLIEAVGPEHAAELDIHYPLANPCTLPNGVDCNQLGADGSLQAIRGPFLQQGIGSNAWAITGQKSITGKPYLCNDLHLVLTLPVIWYANHLAADGINVTGVSIPGLPMILVGHNENIAWGMTLAYTDCEDLFIEQFDPQNPDRYLYRDEWEQAQVIEETIRVKGRKEPVIEKVRITRHGPVISSAVGHKGQDLADCSMSLRPSPTLEGWGMLNTARGWDDFVRAMKKIEAPQLSVAYADTQENIGYWVTGKVPLRPKGDGTLPSPGWTGEYDWDGEIPFEEMPHALNPKNGFFVNCNNKIIPDDYPYFLGNVWMSGYRAARLTEMLETKEKMGPVQFGAMQTDVTCLPGLQFAKMVADLESQDDSVRLALDMLRAWDGKLTAGSAAGSVYEVARYRMIRGMVEPVLGKALTNEYLGVAFNPVLLPDNEYLGNETEALFRMLANPDSWWIAQAGGRNQVLETGLKEAIEWLREKLGPDPEGWQWGKLHRITFGHAMGVQKPLDQVFNRGPFPVGGDTDTPWQATFSPDSPYDNTLWAPSIRHIFDMSDLSRSLYILPTGQSGQIGSLHYDDQTAEWLMGEYRPMLWTRQQVEENCEGRLVLKPFA